MSLTELLNGELLILNCSYS